ncbi:MAG: hypothetical protein M1461_09660, partial [Nitrospirae bacterium]|nr:hypothetical protein [Nitrospirota bacterium]
MSTGSCRFREACPRRQQAGKSPGSTGFIFAGFLFLTAYVTTLFLLAIFRRYHYKGWGLFQEGDFIRMSSGRKDSGMPRKKEPIFIRAIQRLFFVFGKKSGTMMMKDFLVQVRDVRNVHQMLILASLVIVYLVSIASLPLNWVGYTVQLKYIVSFFNLGLILIIIASLCSRLIYPAVVSEGISLWIMKTSPMTPRRYVWTKFFFFFIPLFILGQLLTLFSSFFIGIEKEFVLLMITTTALLSFSLVSMTIAFGISDVKYAAADTAQEQMRTGSTGHMLISVFLILFTLALEIIPIFLYFLKEAEKAAFTQKAWFMIGAVI